MGTIGASVRIGIQTPGGARSTKADASPKPHDKASTADEVLAKVRTASLAGAACSRHSCTHSVDSAHRSRQAALIIASQVLQGWGRGTERACVRACVKGTPPAARRVQSVAEHIVSGCLKAVADRLVAEQAEVAKARPVAST